MLEKRIFEDYKFDLVFKIMSYGLSIALIVYFGIMTFNKLRIS